MNYNREKIAVNLDLSCLLSKGYDEIFYSNIYNIHGGVVRSYFDHGNFFSFAQDITNEQNLMDCVLDVDHELIINIEELKCDFENTNKIFYNGILQPNAWHLDQLDFVNNNSYEYIEEIGINLNQSNITLWILDTGVNWKHNEFLEGQVVDVDPSYNISNITNAHGTGTASISGGVNYGSSKFIKIYSYPVCRMGGSCGSSDIENGFHQVLTWLNYNPGKRAVINLSVGSYYGSNLYNSSLGKYYNGLFKSIEDAGGIIVVAAGNSNMDACGWLYGFSDYVITVGSVNSNYNKSSFSNYGTCVDIWSFGENVPIAYSFTNNSIIQYKSGTSFSSPLVAGLVANLLKFNPKLTRLEILNILFEKQNNMTVPKYLCGQEKKKCCRSPIVNTRLDEYCKTLSLFNCTRGCVIQFC